MRHLLGQLIKQPLYFLELRRCHKKKTPPNSVLFPVIWVTNRCNLRCKMCDQWKTDYSLFKQELTTREWYSFIDSAKNLNSMVIVITGGEPLLRPDIFAIIKYINKKGLVSHLITNGTLINRDTVNKLRNSGVNSISVSLDSYLPLIHNDMRGVDCFNTVVNGIRLLKRGIPDLKLGINYVITKKNFEDLYKMVSFAEDLGVNQIKFDPVHTNLRHRKKSLSSFEDLIFKKEDLPGLREEIEKLIVTLQRSKLISNSCVFLKGIPDLYAGRTNNRLKCYAGYISCAVDPLGIVAPCDNFDEGGNLREEPLEKIWRSELFYTLRNEVNNCSENCWDTTHGELNIRCSLQRNISDFFQVFKEVNFYLYRGKKKKR